MNIQQLSDRLIIVFPPAEASHRAAGCSWLGKYFIMRLQDGIRVFDRIRRQNFNVNGPQVVVFTQWVDPNLKELEIRS